MDQISDLLHIIEWRADTKTYLNKDLRQQATEIVNSIKNEILRLKRLLQNSTTKNAQMHTAPASTETLQKILNQNESSTSTTYPQENHGKPISVSKNPFSTLDFYEEQCTSPTPYVPEDPSAKTASPISYGSPRLPSNLKQVRFAENKVLSLEENSDSLSTLTSQVKVQIIDSVNSPITHSVDSTTWSNGLDVTDNPFRLLFSPEVIRYSHSTPVTVQNIDSKSTYCQDLLVYPGRHGERDILYELEKRVILPSSDHLTITNITRLRNSGISLTLQSKLEAKKLKRLIDSVNTDGLFKCFLPSTKKYKIVVYNAHSLSTADIIHALSTQFGILKRDIRHLRDIKLRSGGHHAVIGIPMQLKHAVGSKGFFSFNWHLLRYKIYIALNRCSKCQSFAHNTASCQEYNFCCAYCGQNHSNKNCKGVSRNEYFCINCYGNHLLFPGNPIFNYNHTTASLQCPSMMWWKSSKTAQA